MLNLIQEANRESYFSHSLANSYLKAFESDILGFITWSKPFK